MPERDASFKPGKLRRQNAALSASRPGLTRPSTFVHEPKDVDGRVKPGQDGIGEGLDVPRRLQRIVSPDNLTQFFFT
jgi:hypothetical protein